MRHRIFGIEQLTITTRKRKKKKKKGRADERNCEAVFFSEEKNGFDVTSSEGTDISLNSLHPMFLVLIPFTMFLPFDRKRYFEADTLPHSKVQKKKEKKTSG